MPGNRIRSMFLKLAAVTIFAVMLSAPLRPVQGQQPGDPHLHFADAIIPKPSGPGLAIFEPMNTGVDSDTAAFGDGCQRWLQFRLGDYPELGQMPRWATQKSVAQELALKDTRLTADTAAPLATVCGYTHFAVGTVTGNADGCTLTYRLYVRGSTVPMGDPVSVSGSRKAIIAALPEMLSRLLRAVDVSPKRLPTAPDLSPTDMVAIGQYPKNGSFEVVEALIGREPLAGLLSLRHQTPPRADGVELMFDTLMKQAPGNLVALSEHADFLRNLTPQLRQKIFQAVPQSPDNGIAALFNYLASKTRQDLLTRVEHWVECAPLDSRAWGRLSFEYNAYAGYIRQGRFANQITQDEWDVLNKLYSRAVAAAHTCVKLDPNYGEAWLELSKTATFASNPKEADEALWKAISLKRVMLGSYLWGLEIYQPKWFDDPAKLKKVATLAAGDTNLAPSELVSLAAELQYLGFTDLAKKAQDRMLAMCRSNLQKDPNNTFERNFLVLQLQEMRRNEESLVESRKNVELDPTEPVYQSELGYALVTTGDYKAAMGPLSEALRLHPSHYSAMAVIGMALQQEGDLDGAESRFRESLSIAPNYYYANFGLASVLFDKKRYDDAFKQFDKASNTGQNRGEPYAMRAIIYTLQNNLDNAMQFAKQAFEKTPDVELSYTALGIVLCASQHTQEGMEALRQAIKIDPTATRPHLALAKVLAKSGKRAEADNEFKAVVRLNSKGQDGKEAQALLGGQR